jgi:hypothetical protein
MRASVAPEKANLNQYEHIGTNEFSPRSQLTRCWREEGLFSG